MLFTNIPAWLAITFLYKQLTINSIGRQALRTILFGTIGLALTRFIVWHLEAPLLLLASIDCIVIALAHMNSAPAIKHGPMFASLALLCSFLSLLLPELGQIFFGFLVVFIGIMVFSQWNRSKFLVGRYDLSG